MNFDVQPGDRVKLIYTDDPYTKLMPGDLGTVIDTDSTGTTFVAWDTGSRLGMVPGTDLIRRAYPGVDC